MDKRVLPFAAISCIQRLLLLFGARRCGLLPTAIDSAVDLLG